MAVVPTYGGETDNIKLAMPSLTDSADVGIINANMKLIDGAIGELPAGSNLQDEIEDKVPTARKVNGHGLSSDIVVTKGDVGLGNVDNTSDADKPVSTAMQTALDTKVNTSDIINNLTSTVTNKPLSAAQGKVLSDTIATKANFVVLPFTNKTIAQIGTQLTNTFGNSFVAFFNAYDMADTNPDGFYCAIKNNYVSSTIRYFCLNSTSIANLDKVVSAPYSLSGSIASGATYTLNLAEQGANIAHVRVFRRSTLGDNYFEGFIDQWSNITVVHSSSAITVACANNILSITNNAGAYVNFYIDGKF